MQVPLAEKSLPFGGLKSDAQRTTSAVGDEAEHSLELHGFHDSKSIGKYFVQIL